MRFTVEMVRPSIFSLTGLSHICQRRQDQPLQLRPRVRQNNGGGIDDILSVLEFPQVTDFVPGDAFLLRQFMRFRIFEKLPEISHAEYRVNAGECGDQRGDVVKICGDNCDAELGELLR